MKTLSVDGGKIATWAMGRGQPLIFLHGGPGDTHHYMKRMAEPLFDSFQCIFFDQRGTGLSPVDVRKPENFRIELLLEDLELVRKAYTSGPALLCGHSWGAMYGLFACMNSPLSYERAALLNMGPLDDEMGQATSENLLRSLTTQERELWGELRRSRNLARDRGELNEVLKFDVLLMNLRVKSWICDPSLHQDFLKDYFQDPPPDREVNALIWNSLGDWFQWEQARKARSSIWLCVGDHDAVPVSQARKVHTLLPASSLSVYEDCGHIPWLEEPSQFYQELRAFLKGSS